MNTKLTILTGLFMLFLTGCFSKKSAETPRVHEEITTNTSLDGSMLEVHFTAGSEHNHPLMAIWIEDMEGNYLQTIYVAKSIAKGVFEHGDASSGKWMPGAIRRPAALPVWSHSHGVKAEDGLYIPSEKNPLPDAVTGATPKANFTVTSKLKSDISGPFVVKFEINQPWDFNEYWTNNKYPDNDEYKTSCQPALVYGITLNASDKSQWKALELLGHAHYAGENGKIYEDVSTITTAREITESVRVILY
ncbi:MAG: hypothetical protein ACOCXS_00055 [Bacteroidota bacterium]